MRTSNNCGFSLAALWTTSFCIHGTQATSSTGTQPLKKLEERADVPGSVTGPTGNKQVDQVPAVP